MARGGLFHFGQADNTEEEYDRRKQQEEAERKRQQQEEYNRRRQQQQQQQQQEQEKKKADPNKLRPEDLGTGGAARAGKQLETRAERLKRLEEENGI